MHIRLRNVTINVISYEKRDYFVQKLDFGFAAPH